MPPHDGCPCLRLALPTAKRVASFRQLLPNRAHKKARRILRCDGLAILSHSGVFLLFMLLRFGQGFLRAVRLIVQSETFRWPLFNALQERMPNQFFGNSFHFLCGFLTFFHMRPPKFIVIYTVLRAMKSPQQPLPQLCSTPFPY